MTKEVQVPKSISVRLEINDLAGGKTGGSRPPVEGAQTVTNPIKKLNVEMKDLASGKTGGARYRHEISFAGSMGEVLTVEKQNSARTDPATQTTESALDTKDSAGGYLTCDYTQDKKGHGDDVGHWDTAD